MAWTGLLAACLLVGSVRADSGILASPAPVQARGREADLDSLVEDCRSADLFFQERAEGELRRRGVEALPALARALLEDPDPQLRLRLGAIFRDLLRVALDDLDSDAASSLRDRAERDALEKVRTTLPEKIRELRQQVEAKREPLADPEEERRVAADLAEKAQRLRAAEEALRDAQARLPDIEARLPERAGRAEQGRKRIIGLGTPAYGPIAARREAVLLELVLHYDGLLEGIREGLGEGIVPGDDGFERMRYLLSVLWAREIDRKGPLAAKVEPLLARHVVLAARDLRSASYLLRQQAEEDLFTLGRRGLAAVKEHAAELPQGQAERLAGLFEWRIPPRVALETGMDFLDYRSLPFRARRRMVIHYARVAGRAAIPTLRLIALGEDRERSLRIRLAAAEALAGPNIRDRSAILAFERLKMPELLKIPEIAREFAILSGVQLLEEKRYEEAVAEFKRVLDEAPYDFQANYRIAFAYLLMKNYPKAILHFEIARRVQPGDDLTLYNLACAYSLDGQVDKSLEALGAAVKAGFADFRHIEADPDLASLRTDPRYHELLDRLRNQGEEDKPTPPRKNEDPKKREKKGG